MSEEKAGGFIKLMREFCERGHGLLNATEAMVYINMLDEHNLHVNVNGGFYRPSNAGLAKHSFCNKATVSKAIAKLESIGLVSSLGEKVKGSLKTYRVYDWRSNEVIMSGTTNKEERAAYLESRGVEAYANFKKEEKEAREALQHPTESQGKQSHAEPVKASQGGAQKPKEDKPLYYAQSEEHLFKYVSEQLGKELNESIIAYLREKAVYGQVIYNEKFKHNVYINYGGKVG